MTLEKYNEIMLIDSSEIIKRINLEWNIKENEKLIEDGLGAIVSCFSLWKIKHSDREDYKTLSQFKSHFEDPSYMGTAFDFFDHLGQGTRWETFIGLKDRFTDDELMAVVFQNNVYDHDESAPEGLLMLIDRLIDAREGDKIIELCANNFEYGLFKKLRGENLDISEYEDLYSHRDVIRFRNIMIGNSNVNICGEYDEITFADRVFVNLGERDTISIIASSLNDNDDSEEIFFSDKSTYAQDRIMTAIASLKENGRAVLLMRGGDLSRKEDEGIRHFLVESGYVGGIIALTDKLYEKTWVNTYILILQKGNNEIRLCDAREVFQKARLISGKHINQLSEEDVEKIYSDYISGTTYTFTVSEEDIRKNGYVLLPQRYKTVNSDRKTVKLGDCIASLKRGIRISGKESDQYLGKEGIKCITPSSLFKGTIANPVYFDADNFGRKVNYAHRLDLLINMAGKPIKAAVADGTYAVIGNVYILKIKYGSISPYYIKCFLESPKGQAEIMKYMVGESAPVLTIPNLEKIEIPIFEKEKQFESNKRAEKYTFELQKAIDEMEQLDEMYE